MIMIGLNQLWLSLEASHCAILKKIHKEQGIATGQKLAMSLTKTSYCIQLPSLEKDLYLIN